MRLLTCIAPPSAPTRALRPERYTIPVAPCSSSRHEVPSLPDDRARRGRAALQPVSVFHWDKRVRNRSALRSICASSGAPQSMNSGLTCTKLRTVASMASTRPPPVQP